MEPGFSGATKLAYASDEPLDPVRDLATDSAKDEFTARVLEPQRLATQLIPPHFHVRGEADFDLNVQLARTTVRVAEDPTPVRAVLSVSLRDFLAKTGMAECGSKL